MLLGLSACQAVSGACDYTVASAGGGGVGGSGAESSQGGGSNGGAPTGGAGGGCGVLGCLGDVLTVVTVGADDALDQRGHGIVRDGPRFVLAGGALGTVVLDGACGSLTVPRGETNGLIASFTGATCESAGLFDHGFFDDPEGLFSLSTAGRTLDAYASDDAVFVVRDNQGVVGPSFTDWNTSNARRIAAVPAPGGGAYVAVEFAGNVITIEGVDITVPGTQGAIAVAKVDLDAGFDATAVAVLQSPTVPNGRVELGGLGLGALGAPVVYGSFSAGGIALDLVVPAGPTTSLAPNPAAAFLVTLDANTLAADADDVVLIEGAEVGSYVLPSAVPGVPQALVQSGSRSVVLAKGDDLAVDAEVSPGSGLHLLEIDPNQGLIASRLVSGSDGSLVEGGATANLLLATREGNTLELRALDSAFVDLWLQAWTASDEMGSFTIAHRPDEIALLGWFRGTLTGPLPSPVSAPDSTAWLYLTLRGAP